MRHSKTNHNVRPHAAWRQSHCRPGTFMLELVVGAAILGIFLSAIGPMFRWIQETKRTNERHLVAMQELSTQMEQIAALPASDLTDKSLQSIVVSESTLLQLSDAELTATLTPDNDRMQRVTLSLSWVSNNGLTVDPKRLTAWFPLESKGETE